MYTGFRDVFVTRRTDTADEFGVNTHVGVTAGFTFDGEPGGMFGIGASSPRCQGLPRCS
jgi:hypothetical protein